jgi:hypothetical protein
LTTKIPGWQDQQEHYNLKSSEHMGTTSVMNFTQISFLLNILWHPKHGKTHVIVDGQVLPTISSQNLWAKMGGGGWGESDPTQHYRKHANIRWGKYIQCYMKPTNIRYIHQLDHGTDAYRQVPGWLWPAPYIRRWGHIIDEYTWLIFIGDVASPMNIRW